MNYVDTPNCLYVCTNGVKSKINNQYINISSI